MTTSSIHLPGHLVSRQPSGTPDSLRTVAPTIVAPTTGDSAAYAIGTHVIRIRANMETAEAVIDGVPVMFVTDRDGRSVHVLADSAHGITEVTGWSADQLDAVRREYFSGLGTNTAKPLTAGKSSEVDRLVALADTLDHGGESADAEVRRLAELAESLGE